MATLHLLSHSPFSDGRLNSCLPLLGDTDALLLAGDATYALTAGTKPATELEQLPEQVALFALEEDVQARAELELREYGGVNVGQPHRRVFGEQVPAAGLAPFADATVLAMQSDNSVLGCCASRLYNRQKYRCPNFQIPVTR